MNLLVWNTKNYKMVWLVLTFILLFVEHFPSFYIWRINNKNIFGWVPGFWNLVVQEGQIVFRKNTFIYRQKYQVEAFNSVSLKKMRKSFCSFGFRLYNGTLITRNGQKSETFLSLCFSILICSETSTSSKIFH